MFSTRNDYEKKSHFKYTADTNDQFLNVNPKEMNVLKVIHFILINIWSLSHQSLGQVQSAYRECFCVK